MFEIVKRKYIRQARHLVLANQRRPRRPSAPDVFGKQMSSMKVEDRSFLYRVCPLPRARTSIMRVIKCRKSIWWMPWR